MSYNVPEIKNSQMDHERNNIEIPIWVEWNKPNPCDF